VSSFFSRGKTAGTLSLAILFLLYLPVNGVGAEDKVLKLVT
jgi:hypothetical protein